MFLSRQRSLRSKSHRLRERRREVNGVRCRILVHSFCTMFGFFFTLGKQFLTVSIAVDPAAMPRTRWDDLTAARSGWGDLMHHSCSVVLCGVVGVVGNASPTGWRHLFGQVSPSHYGIRMLSL